MTKKKQYTPMTDDQIKKAAVGELKPHDAPITLVPYDPTWPELYAREAKRIRVALGQQAIMIEHVGSTSVPGLTAKPIIDILVAVRDSSKEPSYVPLLEKAGYRLTIREPDWHQHRLFKGPDTNINMHVFTIGSVEIERTLRLRDWLRNNPDDRKLYAETKEELSRQKWHYVQNYADAKSKVIETILARAKASAKKTWRTDLFSSLSSGENPE